MNELMCSIYGNSLENSVELIVNSSYANALMYAIYTNCLVISSYALLDKANDLVNFSYASSMLPTFEYFCIAFTQMECFTNYRQGDLLFNHVVLKSLISFDLDVDCTLI